MNTAVCCMYDDLEALNVDVVDVKLKNNFAIAFFDNFLVIDRSKCKTAAQERTVLAHEAGHYMSGAFYRAYSPFEVKEQAEHRAFAASVEKYLPVNEILNCYKMGMTENWEIAEYFNLEEEFVEKAVHYWTDCKGIDLAILVILAIPLGAYIKNVMSGEKTFLSKVLTPCENLIYKVTRVDREEQMTWKKYAVSVMIFSGIGLVFLFLLQLLQGVLPGNPQNLSGVKWDLAFNTSASFITNTNWQAYSGESTLSYLTQALGLTVQNFVSAATGIAVLFALIRGFIKVKSSGLGSFWVDLTRIVVHILLPLNLVISLLLVGGGVIQNLKSAETVSLVEPIAVSAEGEILEDAVIDLDTETVTVDGEIVSNAQIVTEQFVPMGPAASQVAIKQTGTNGGGYMGVNSAHPLENPNAFTNLIEMISILLIPAALCFTFGSAVKNKKQGVAIFMAMFLCLVVALSCIAVTEQV